MVRWQLLGVIKAVYRRITLKRPKIADALAMPGLADIEFDPPRANISFRPADFS